MHRVDYDKLEALSKKLDSIINGPLVEEDIYQNLITLLVKLERDIESDIDSYGLEAKKMVNLCLLMRFKLETKVSELLEENYEKRFIN